MQHDSSDACADILTLTREQLYDRVWDEPAYMLAPQLGISDVALAKTCKRLGIPKPSRGYWARLATGQRMQKDKLPPAKPNQPQIVQFHVADNLKRRDEAKKASESNSSVESWPEQLPIPESETTLHPIAERLMSKIRAAKPTEDGRVQIRSANFSDIVCSPMLAFRVAGALHVIAASFVWLNDRTGTLAMTWFDSLRLAGMTGHSYSPVEMQSGPSANNLAFIEYDFAFVDADHGRTRY
jgi:hypothetical protein